MQEWMAGDALLLAPRMMMCMPNDKNTVFYILSVESSNDMIVLSVVSVPCRKYAEKTISLQPGASVLFIYLQEISLEFLYENDDETLCFFDPAELIDWNMPPEILANRRWMLKTGIEVKGLLYKDRLIDVVLAGFVDYMVMDIEMVRQDERKVRMAILETGGRIEVPDSIDISDIIKIDTVAKCFLQRV